MRRALTLSALASMSVLLLSTAGAGAQPASGAVIVADVRGPLDQRALDFLTAAVETPDAQVVVLQIDNPGIASGDPSSLIDAIVASRTPIAAWVGPAGAEAYGGVAALLAFADTAGAAQGARIGYPSPIVARGADDLLGGDPARPDRLAAIAAIDGTVDITSADAGTVMLDSVVPTIGQFIAGLDGKTLDGVVVETAQERTLEDGTVVLEPSVQVRFIKPDVLTRTFRLASRPEATFFFLVTGLAAVAFEFYAAGVGITAGVASLCLVLAGYGVATLPIDWGSLVAVLVGMAAWTADFQRNQVRWRSVVGTVLLVYGGLTLTTAAPQFAPRWWAIALTVLGAGLFYVFALTTVMRARFSTRTIGREYLVGRLGVAETGFDPEGYVLIDGGRWRARSHRAAGIAAGDRIEVLEVNGIVLEVGPPQGGGG
jgi:membrane-bound serine protease (ClpP class)